MNFLKRSTSTLLVLISWFIISTEAVERPKLVSYISIDQMKAEYLESYRAEFTGGFRRFLESGAVFTNAELNYAPNETGPGHASLGTGSYPEHSGILLTLHRPLPELSEFHSRKPLTAFREERL